MEYTLKTPPDILYFASPDQVPVLKGKVFLTPYLGIASIFTIDMDIIKFNLVMKYKNRIEIRSINFGYDEWDFPNRRLTKPLSKIHIVHNVKELQTRENGISSGYIHFVDVSNIKDRLTLFTTNDPDREVIYTGETPLTVIKIIPHKVAWTMEFDQDHYDEFGPGQIITKEVQSVKKITIDNSKKVAVTSKEWKPDKKKLLETALSSSTPMTLLKEIFLQVDKSKRKDHFIALDMIHYPHHDIVEKTQEPHFIKYTCVLNIKGVQAAYARAKQMGVYEGALKEHIDGHRKALGLMDKDDKLQEAANNIDLAFDLLTEALKPTESGSSGDPGSNIFEDFMSEAPVVTMGGANTNPPAPQPAAPPAPQPAQAAAQPAPQPQAAPMDLSAAQPQQPQEQSATIPVQYPNPSEDTSTNNPNEGPDTRDPDNLDGNARKEQYQAFADALKSVDGDNIFGTIFDEDIFKSEYKIVPYEMRYFYRLQNPVSVASGDFEFIPFGTELIEAQEKYDLGKKMFVFALYSEKPVFFNQLDKTIWFNDKKVGETFDGFIDQITQDQGNIDFTGDDGDDANVVPVDGTQSEPDPNNPLANDAIDLSPPPDPNAPDPNAPMDLSAAPAPSAPIAASTSTDFGPENLGAPANNEIAPMDLTQQNASLDGDSILESFFESGISDAALERYLSESSYMEERSHGNLNYEFRIVVGEDDGHLYKVVYDLNPDNVTANNISRGEARDALAKDIKKSSPGKYGNYQSKGNKVVAIVDLMSDNKRVKSISAFPPIHNSGGDIRPMQLKSYLSLMKGLGVPDDKIAKEREKLTKEYPNGTIPSPAFKSAMKDSVKKGQNPILYTVGEIDTSETYKTTNVKNVVDGMLHLDLKPKKESIEDKSILASMFESITDDGLFEEILGEMFEGTAFPNDALNEKNRITAEQKKRRQFGSYMID